MRERSHSLNFYSGVEENAKPLLSEERQMFVETEGKVMINLTFISVL